MTDQQDRILIRGGSVLTCEPTGEIYPEADVLIVGDRIEAVGESLGTSGATVIDAADFVVMPGLIDGHRHATDAVYSQFSNDLTLIGYFAAVPGPHGGASDDDLYRGSRGAARLAIDAGVTTHLDWSLSAQSFSGASAALDGYVEAGSRVLFAYGPGAGVIGVDPDLQGSTIYDDTRRLRDRCRAEASGLLNLMVAARGPEFTRMEIAKQEIELARALELHASMHMGGLTIGMHEKTLELEAEGLLGPDLHFAHCCLLSDAEMRAMAEAGVRASVSPYVETALGIGPSAYRRLRDHGVKTGLSVDSAALAGHGLFSEARAMLALERSPVHTETLRRGEDPTDNSFLTSSDAIQAMTYESARALGLEDEIGSLAPGKAADVILIDKNRLGTRPLNGPSALVLSGEATLIDTVIVGGVVRKRHGELTDASYVDVVRDLAAVRDHGQPVLPGVAWLP